MNVDDSQPAANPAPRDVAAMLAGLLGEGYRVTFSQDAASSDYFADLTGPLGSQATGLGGTPAGALLSVWPLTDAPAAVGGQEDDVTDGPAVAAVARKVAALREYIAGALADETAGRQCALEHAAGELAALGALLAGGPGDAEDDDGGLEPYCGTCGEFAGMFLGMDGWHHFRGDPAPGGERTLYDAGHEVVPAWCVPPGRALSPAGVATVRQALADAAAWRTWRTGGDRAADTELAAAYERVLRILVTTGEAVQR